VKTIREYFKEAHAQNAAIGHFNFASPDVLRAIVRGAQDGGAPCVMVGTSPRESDFLGLTTAVALVKTIREASDFPVFLNADHFPSFELCKDAIDAGYDSVLCDGSRHPLDINISETRRVVSYMREHNPDGTVEGELGYLRGSSKVQSKVSISPSDFTDPIEAAQFVKKTGVDRLAVAFGNIHGIVTDQKEQLDFGHLARIISLIQSTTIVLHGASGLSDLQIRTAISSGIRNIHFNTELRVAYANALRHEMSDNPNEIVPPDMLAPAENAVRLVVTQKTHLFGFSTQ